MKKVKRIYLNCGCAAYLLMMKDGRFNLWAVEDLHDHLKRVHKMRLDVIEDET